MYVTIVHQGGPIRNPFDPPEPVPAPAPAPTPGEPVSNPWIIFGILLGCVIFVGLAGTGGWFLWRWWSTRGVVRN